MVDSEARRARNVKFKMYKQYKKTRKISKLKKNIVSALFLSGMMLLLTGCSHVTSEMKAGRENGIALMESGDYEGAVAEFDSLIDQTTRVTSFEIDVLKYRGEAEFMLGDYGAAAYTYDTLARVDKPRAEYYYLGAVSLANSGDQDGAENRLESGKSADAKHEVTGYAEAMEALGAAYMTAGDEEKADELYQTLVDEGFSSTEVYNRWMMAAMEKGNYEEALQHAEAGLALSDDRAKKEIAFNQAVCYEYLGQYEKALELFRSYEEQYGQDEKADHEIAFLVTR